MSLIVHPDPQQPAGGFAFFELPEGRLTGEEEKVAIFDAYGERWLAEGDGQWQADPHEFGPYKVYRHEGADWLRIGPEIVDRIEEYAPLKIRVAGRDYDVNWPDDVPPRAGAAVRGGLQPVARAQAEESVSQLVGRVQNEPEPVEAEKPKTMPEQPQVETAAVQEPVRRSPRRRRRLRRLLLALLVILLLLAGGLLWWYFDPLTLLATEEPVQNNTEEEVIAQEVVPENPCSREALRAISGGFEGVDQRLRECGSEVSADTALALVETYAGVDDPAALYLFGALYDGETLEARIENLIGLSFEPDDAKAAEYYARAVEAGSDRATATLAATCERLSGSGDTLARGAFDDYCR